MMAVFDLHCDTITEYHKRGYNFCDGGGHYSFANLPKGECWCQCFAIWMPDELRGPAAEEYFEENYRFFISQLEQYPRCIGQAFSMQDVQNLMKQGRNPAILTIEGGSALAGKLERVSYLRGLGVRMMTLTWNGVNEIAAGSTSQGGVSEFGRAAIAEMEREGIIVDVSHLNEQSFDEVMAMVTRPVVASHSNSRLVFGHKRNLTDEQFLTIVRQGGLVGINLYKEFIDSDNPSFSRLMDHIKHFIQLGGEYNIALGSDFDGADVPEYVSSPAKLANLRPVMIQSGLSSEQVENLYYCNAKRFFERYGL